MNLRNLRDRTGLLSWIIEIMRIASNATVVDQVDTSAYERRRSESDDGKIHDSKIDVGVENI